MPRATLATLVLASLLPVLALGAESATPANLPVATIVERHVAASGGLAAWRAVQTMSWTGKMEAGSATRPSLATQIPGQPRKPAAPPGAATTPSQVLLPFVMEMQRPNKSRLEVTFNGENAVQVYDGTQGWKLRPYLNRLDVDPFTPDELKSMSTQSDIDGPLIDYAAKGTKVALAGSDTVEGHPAYKLELTLKDKQVRHVWIDAQSFLQLKMEGTPRRMDGRMRTVFVYSRDYKPVNGLMIAHLLETTVEGYKATEKILIDTVVINPRLEGSRFTKPG